MSTEAFPPYITAAMDQARSVVADNLAFVQHTHARHCAKFGTDKALAEVSVVLAEAFKDEIGRMQMISALVLAVERMTAAEAIQTDLKQIGIEAVRATDGVAQVLEQRGLDKGWAADRLRSLAAQWPGLAAALARQLQVMQGTVPMVWRELL